MEHPLVVAANLAEVIEREQQWLCLAARNYPTIKVQRFLQHSAERVQWAIVDQGLPKLTVRMEVVADDVGELTCTVQIGWTPAGRPGLAVRDASRRLFAPVARA